MDLFSWPSPDVPWDTGKAPLSPAGCLVLQGRWMPAAKGTGFGGFVPRSACPMPREMLIPDSQCGSAQQQDWPVPHPD